MCFCLALLISGLQSWTILRTALTVANLFDITIYSYMYIYIYIYTHTYIYAFIHDTIVDNFMGLCTHICDLIKVHVHVISSQTLLGVRLLIRNDTYMRHKSLYISEELRGNNHEVLWQSRTKRRLRSWCYITLRPLMFTYNISAFPGYLPGHTR